jgi:hypothetical protein
MSRFGVQHWVACLGAAVVPPVGVNNFYNLFGVGHVHTYAGDVEFPAVIPELNMFVRFVNGTGVMQFEVELVWFDVSGGARVVENLGLQQVTFRSGESLRDVVFRFWNVPIAGTGSYAVQLSQHRSRRLRVFANEYFSVERLP